MAWPIVRLGDVVSCRKEYVTIHPDVTYSRCRIQTAARGIILRDRIDGSHIKTKKQQVCRAGDFLVAEIDAKVGGFGIVPRDLDGAIVSSHYFIFDVDSRRLVGDFLGWYSRTRCFREQVKARGSTNYAAIRPQDVLGYRIPLPNLSEQQIIASRLNRFQLLVDEALTLSQAILREVCELVQSVHFQRSIQNEQRLGDLLELWEDRVPVEPHRCYRQVGVRGYARGLFFKEAVLGADTRYSSFNRLRDGLLVVSQPKGWEGAVAVCDPSYDGWYVSPEYRTFRCKTDLLDERYFAALLPTPWFQTMLASLTRGQGARRQRLRPEMFLDATVRMPSIEHQRASLRWFDALQHLQAARSSAAQQAQAMLPAVMQKIFGPRQ